MSLHDQDKKALVEIARRNHAKFTTKNGWHNFTGHQDEPFALVLDVQDKESLQIIMRALFELNQKHKPEERLTLRAAAGGLNEKYSQSFSFSDVSEADVIVRLVGKEFQHVERVPGESAIVNVGGSIQIGTLHKILDEQFDLTLPTSSLIPYVTVAGLTATGGHGTGIDQPSFPGLIRSMTMCLPNGDIVKIDKNHPDFETIRGAHLGLFGIVLDVDLECIPGKKLECLMQVRSVPQFLEEVKNGLFVNPEWPNTSVLYLPFYKNDLTDKDAKNVIIYRWHPVDKNIKDVNNHPNLMRFDQAAQIELAEDFHIMDLLRAHPSLIPPYMQYLAAQLVVGDKDALRIGSWHDVAHYQNSIPKRLAGIMRVVSCH